MGKTWIIESGCGGVGKSTVAVSLALCASLKGKKTFLLDLNLQRRSIDLILGIESIVAVDMVDVLEHGIDLNRAVYTCPQYPNLSYICASLCGEISSMELCSSVLALQSMCDLLVIDTSTEVHTALLDLLSEEDRMIIVARPDIVSLRSCEYVLAKLRNSKPLKYTVINQPHAQAIGRRQMVYTPQQVEMILDCPVIGTIQYDRMIEESNRVRMKNMNDSGYCSKQFQLLLNRLV